MRAREAFENVRSVFIRAPALHPTSRGRLAPGNPRPRRNPIPHPAPGIPQTPAQAAEALYVYNMANPANDFRVNETRQAGEHTRAHKSTNASARVSWRPGRKVDRTARTNTGARDSPPRVSLHPLRPSRQRVDEGRRVYTHTHAHTLTHTQTHKHKHTRAR